MEVPFYAQKSMWHLILSGVFERFPQLKYVMTEQGVSWVKPTLDRMDTFWNQMTNTGRVGELGMTADQMLPQKPSNYFQQNCWVGASFPAPSDAQAIQELGVDRVMWGSDYPHDEGTYPHTKEALRNTFAGWSEQDLRSVLGHNAAHVYQMDLDKLTPLAEQYGPTIEELQQPLTNMPDNASPAFTRG
jgi:predicted TIM-barrel fold metal-dependent hydrolase